MTGGVERARAAFARQQWTDAYEGLAAASTLAADDLERLAVAAHLLGREAESGRAWERAHLEHVRRHDLDGAARCAGWLALGLTLNGETAQARGWCARATHLLDEESRDCAARGLLQVPMFLEALGRGDAHTAARLAADVADIARRFDDKDVLAIGLLSRGEAWLALGETARGLTQLDEVMVAVAAGEVSPIPSALVYCAVIAACMDVLDLQRAAEWTDVLDRWCAGQPDIAPYRGICLVHRAQVLQAHGEWAKAASEAEQAMRRLSRPAHPALGLALFQQGELHRLRGRVADAERAYRAASESGREPAPGIALLRLVTGDLDAAVAAIGRMVDESRGHLSHPTMLSAGVEIMIASGDVDAARSYADELDDLVDADKAPLLHALAAYATGTVLLAEGDAASALACLRRAFARWRDLGMPYEAARARLQIGLACRAVGDHATARLEIDAARAVFERLGAHHDLVRTRHLADPSAHGRRADLTRREHEVLRLLATGTSNREIARVLVISEHTVGRHLQNIYTKLGLSSRAAATAYAYEHDLV